MTLQKTERLPGFLTVALHLMNDLKPVLSPEGWDLLNSLPPYDAQEAFRLNQRLRDQGHSPETVAAALTQSQFRFKAREKFGEFAERMLFTREGLQQATRLPVAARHAQRFREAGLQHVADLGCGLGGDAMAMASLGLMVTAVEADETTAAAATMNLLAFPEAEVRHTTAEEYAAEAGLLIHAENSTDGAAASASVPTGWGVWLDPARRDPAEAASKTGQTKRIWNPEAFSPPLSFVTQLAATGIPLGVKLGPGLPHDMVPEGCEAEWVSIDGDVVEVVLWFNALARPGIRRAATVLRSGTVTREITSAEDFGQGIQPEVTGREGLSGTLYEPDGTVIRAGLVAELAAQLGGHLMDEHIAYICTPGPDGHTAGREQSEPEQAPLARGYRVLEVMDFNVKTLKQWAQDTGVASLEIKKRGVDVVPEQLRTQILGGKKGSKKNAAKNSSKASGASATSTRTLILTRIGEDRLAAVVEALEPPV